MAQRVRDILLRIRGDASDAEQDLHNIAQDLKRFDGMTAEATVDVNTAAAELKIKSAKNAAQAFGRMSETAKVDFQTRAAELKLEGLRKNLENLQKRPTEPKIEIAIGKTVAQIERVEAQLDKLDRRRVDIDIDVDRRGLGALAGGVASGIGAAAQGVGVLVSAAARGIPVIGGLGALFVQLGISGAALGPIIIAAAVALTAVLLPAVILTGGAIVALTASFLAAAAAVGVLGVALAAAFGPVLLVAIATMARFAKVLEAVKSREDDVAEGARNVRDANRAQAQAQETAVTAAQRVRTTAVDAYRAWRDAAEETSDAIRSITDAELSRERAQLTLKQAKQDLADFRKETGLTGDSLDGLFKKFTDVDFRPKDLVGAIRKSAVGGAAEREGVDPLELADKILRVKEAQQGVVNAEESVSDAVTRANDARERENEFIQNGIRAYEPYTAAVAANAAAQKAVAEATKDTAEAHEKQNEALKDLTPQERRLVTVLTDLKDALTDAFRPATRAVFAGLLDMLEDLADFVKDPGVRRGFRIIGEAIGDMFRAFGRVLRSRETREAFGEIASAAGRMIRRITPVFTSLFEFVTRLAQVAMPWLETVIGRIGDAIRNWADDKDKAGIEAWVRRLRRSFNIWIGIVKELWGIVKAFFGDAKESGDEMAESIRQILRRLRIWLETNPDKIESFFEAVTWSAETFLTVLDAVVTAIKWISEHKGPSLRDLVRDSTVERIKGPSGIDIIKMLFGQSGGLVPGVGAGDRIPAMLEPGEFVIRRSVAQSIGVGRLNLLNAGNMAALSGGRGGVHIENINLPPAPGHNQMGDPRHQAAQFARELRRRGEIGLSGGGIP